MTSEQLPFALDGSTLIVGPSGVGKTHMTARAVMSYVAHHGPTGITILDFGPEILHDGQLIGRRIDRFTDIPDGVWYGTLDANAPRAQSRDPTEARRLAMENAEGARALIDAAPADPNAVFVNDVTIATHVSENPLDKLIEYCSSAACVVMNAYEGTALGVDDPISKQEHSALERLIAWADTVVRIGEDGTPTIERHR